MSKFVVHVFRRDLRLKDNTALNAALATNLPVVPLFIFDPAQSSKNPYFSEFGFKFLLESLYDLDSELKKIDSSLRIFEGNPSEVLSSLQKTYEIPLITFNRDYTPFAKKRDQEILKTFNINNEICKIYDDALLVIPEESVKPDGSPYTVFTPFFKKNQKSKVKQPYTHNGEFLSSKAEISNQKSLSQITDPSSLKSFYKGGRSEAVKILENLSIFSNYKEERNIPSLDRTTHLSPHFKFGTISAREAYHKISSQFTSEHTLITELYWRDFFTSIAHFYPRVFTGSFNEIYNKLEWCEDEEKFKHWCEGTTGFPIVDAGMRELNQTGFMHNRVRMIVASFLTKDLRISWRWGERYFATKLVDYDPSVNNGNWQWAASTGCDAQPYFRIFNPWLQQKKFDPDCAYIKKWVTELKDIEHKKIHEISESPLSLRSYPNPIVDHSKESQLTKDMFKKVRS